MATIYLAGGLFNAGERLHNLYLEKYLQKLSYTVILPQREALKFFDGNTFDVNAIREHCKQQCTDPDNVYVGNVNGADADSGSAVEYGMAIIQNEGAVVYRTDFRTTPDKEVGLNAMFRGKETIFVYYPCFFTELDQVEAYYEELAHRIHYAICELS